MYKNIAILIGMPRSGTSWLSQIIDSSPDVRFRLSPIFSYAFKNAVTASSSRSEYESLFHGAYSATDDFMDQSYRRAAGEYPVWNVKNENPRYLLIKMTRFHNLISRMMELFDDLKMIAIVRHPCGAIHSWLTTPGEFPETADPMAEWRFAKVRKTSEEEFWGFEDWKTVTRLHLQLQKKYPERFYIIRYEDLVSNALKETEKVFNFLNLEITEQTKKFIIASQSQSVDNSYAVYKLPSVKERWKSGLQPDIRDQILAETAGTDLEVFAK